jgi:hypothetical protein
MEILHLIYKARVQTKRSKLLIKFGYITGRKSRARR